MNPQSNIPNPAKIEHQAKAQAEANLAEADKARGDYGGYIVHKGGQVAENIRGAFTGSPATTGTTTGASDTSVATGTTGSGTSYPNVQSSTTTTQTKTTENR